MKTNNEATKEEVQKKPYVNKVYNEQHSPVHRRNGRMYGVVNTYDSSLCSTLRGLTLREAHFVVSALIAAHEGLSTTEVTPTINEEKKDEQND